LLSVIFFGIMLIPKQTQTSERYIRLAADNSLPRSKRIEYNQAAFKIELSNKNHSKRKILFQIATNFISLNCWDQLKETSRVALSESQNANVETDVAQAYRFLGIYYIYTSKNDSAYYYLGKSKKILLRINKPEALAKLYQSIALVQYFNCDYLSSMSTYIKAFKLAKVNEDYETQYIALFNIGIILKDLGEYQKSDDYNLKAKKIAETKLNRKDD